MRALFLAALVPVVLAAAASAQTANPSTPGMTMPAAQPATGGASAQAGAAQATESVGSALPPPPITDHAADTAYSPRAMAAARAELRREHGGESWSMVTLNLAEYQARGDGGGYRWDGAASFGGDIDRLVLKSEGDGAGRGVVESAEVQALYSRAVGPYYDLQAGVRQDIRHGRTFAAVGVEGLAPYWFEVSGAVFVSPEGEVLGRLEGWDDLRITQRLVLQPRAELNLSAEDAPDLRLGGGVTDLELGLRLGWELERNFAPYIGLSYDWRLGATASFARLHGDAESAPVLVAGIRSFF